MNRGDASKIQGCDLHSRQQTLAMLDVDTGEVEERVLAHEGEQVREFYAGLPGPVRVGIEATGSMHRFLELMSELGVARLPKSPGAARGNEKPDILRVSPMSKPHRKTPSLRLDDPLFAVKQRKAVPHQFF